TVDTTFCVLYLLMSPRPLSSTLFPYTTLFRSDLIKQAFTKFGDQIEENLPKSLIDKYRLFSRDQAMYAMHFPKDPADHHQAKRRVVFEEFFLFQMKIQGLKQEQKSEKNGLAISYDIEKVKMFTRRLPFEARKSVV